MHLLCSVAFGRPDERPTPTWWWQARGSRRIYQPRRTLSVEALCALYYTDGEWSLFENQFWLFDFAAIPPRNQWERSTKLTFKRRCIKWLYANFRYLSVSWETLMFVKWVYDLCSKVRLNTAVKMNGYCLVQAVMISVIILC